MYNALSLAFCGTEHLSVVIRLLTTYALVKHRTAMIDALSHIYFNGNHEQHVQALTDTAQGNPSWCVGNRFALILTQSPPKPTYLLIQHIL